MDHCVECLCSLSGNPYSDGLAVAALSLLVRGLRGVQKDPSDMEARSQCQLGIFQALPGREENTKDDVCMWWVQPIIKTGHMKLWCKFYVNKMERFQMSCLKGPDLLKQKCSMHFKRIHCADIKIRSSDNQYEWMFLGVILSTIWIHLAAMQTLKRYIITVERTRVWHS